MHPLYHPGTGKSNMNKCEITPKKQTKIRAFLAKKTEFHDMIKNEILFEKYLERFRDL